MAEKKNDICGFSGQPWPQYQEEIQPFIALLVSEGATSYLEVGCRYGDTFHTVASALPQGSRVVALDLPGAKSGMVNKGGHQSSGTYLKRAADDLRKKGYDATVILGDSHDPEIQAKALCLGPFDCIFIDGDHTEAGVRADYKAFSPVAKMVAFHDVCGQGKWAKQIRPIFHEVRQGRKWKLFSHDGLRRGIGVIWL